MIVLGIESSCDETSAAVVKDGDTLLSVVTNSSMDLHAQYGGVVPEIAARSHIECINGVITQAIEESGCTWDDINAIAVTYGAGLGGSLLIGVLTARTLAIVHNKPLYAINHVEGHVYANFITKVGHFDALASSTVHSNSANGEDTFPRHSHGNGNPVKNGVANSNTQNWIPNQVGDDEKSQTPSVNERIADYRLPATQPVFPMLALIVSGGHSQLAVFRDHFDYTLLGQTQDDAIGEAFDKVAKIIGVPYPGGPNVEKKAAGGNAHAFDFPKANMHTPSPALVELRANMATAHGPLGASEKRAGEEQAETSGSDVSPAEGLAPPKTMRKEKLIPSYDFSFSGVKTAVLRAAQASIGEDHSFPSKDLPDRLSETQKADLAASFQRTAVETVVDKTIEAYEEFAPASVVIAGGVAASPALREMLAERLPCPIAYTDRRLCTDNAAMIATLGCFHMKLGRPAADPYSLEIAPNLSM